MTQAYRLRAPGQKGVHLKAWGSFVGLLLRSIDRADEVYHSMLLRGYNGNFVYTQTLIRNAISPGKSVLYGMGWIPALLFLRMFPLFTIVGGMIC